MNQRGYMKNELKEMSTISETSRTTPEARRGSQGASRAAPGKSGLHARGEGERVLALAAAPLDPPTAPVVVQAPLPQMKCEVCRCGGF